MSAITYWVWLSANTEISARARAALIRYYGDAERIYLAPDGEYQTIQGVSFREAGILERRDISASEHILEECDRTGIDVITFQDARYPMRLKNIYAPPAVLYVKGRLPDVDAVPAIAVIGTRSASEYGLRMGRRLAFEIAKCGGAVISTLSDGIDREAAKGCLTAGGKCIGILGTAHRDYDELYTQVAASGALLSEYPPGTATQRHFFRDRNRIASGLSYGLTVVEAPQRSGCMLFAADALEQGREIFAVPGNADAHNSVGTIELLKQGAKPVTCGWDVMCELESVFPGTVSRPSEEQLSCPELSKEAESLGKGAEKPANSPKPPKKEIDKKNDREYIDLNEQLSGLDPEQLQIISAIGKDGAHIDDIIESTGLSAAKVLSKLTVLEIKGYVRRLPGRRVSLIISSK